MHLFCIVALCNAASNTMTTYVASNNKTYRVLHVKCPIFLSDLKKIRFYRKVLIKVSNIKFNGNSSSWRHVWTDGRTD
jgi:hypothetical protein